MATVDIPQASVHLGFADAQGRRVPVTISMEWMRAFEDMRRELASLRADLTDAITRIEALEP